MLLQRVLTAIVGIPLFIFLIHAGDIFFTGAVSILAAVALYELNNMAKQKNAGIYFCSGMIPVIVLCLSTYFVHDIPLLYFIVSMAILLVMLEGIVKHTKENWFYNNLYSILAICYIGVFFAQIILLREYRPDIIMPTFFGTMPMGEILLWLALIGTWASDTFAYFIGTAIGKHKLCPAISPNKSWEGAIGGFIGCIVSVYLFGEYIFYITSPDFMTFHSTEINLIIFGIIVAFFAPLGDLAQSQIKRFSGVKDSGKIFPGHGGVLDRFDSLLFVAPAICFYLYINHLYINYL